jgi:hypothetical protein
VAVLTASAVVVGPKVVELVGAHTSDHERLSLKPLAERSYIFDSAGNLLASLAPVIAYRLGTEPQQEVSMARRRGFQPIA